MKIVGYLNYVKIWIKKSNIFIKKWIHDKRNLENYLRLIIV